ncbi:hypothetical protein CR513_19489, partial [Mucuna pruriens]
MEMDLMKDQVRRVTIALFLYGFNRQIQDFLVHQASKVEMQIRRRSASRKTYMSSSGWKGKR